MEPLNVALAVVQFVDFTSKLVAATWKIHTGESFGSERMTHILDISEDLGRLIDGLERSLLSPISGDVALLNMARKCKTLGERLRETLKKLQYKRGGAPKNSKVWDSFQIALREKWHENDIKAMGEDLQNYRQQITMHLVMSQVELIATTNHEVKEGITNASKDQLQAIRSLQVQLDDTNGKLDYLAVVQQSYKGGIMIATPSSQVLQVLHRIDTDSVNQHVIEKLQFQEMGYRYKRIVVAHEKTFEWLFQPPKEPGTWANFSDWIRSDDTICPLYWITGKPGAGKSTLMRFLIEHERTVELSGIWKTNRRLLRASFFFWNSGTPLQMSYEGLVRSLLHQILTQVPGWTQVALPHRVLDMMLFGEQIWRTQWVWSQEELTNAFKTLIEDLAKTCNIMIFIDGMDEFNGNLIDVIEFVQDLCRIPGVKVCASSRPWNRFRDSFEHRPHLQVERLTYDDIYAYVDSTLRSSQIFQGYEHSHPGFPGSLIQDVCSKSEGVFLWVRLVTLSLLDGVMDGEKPAELEERLEEIPNELEDLFEKILWQTNPKDPRKLERASQLFQIHRALAATAPASLLRMSFADECTPEDALSAPMEILTPKQFHARAEQMRRRINACTRGLLDANTREDTELPSVVITLLHRTVKDYLYREDVWERLCAASPPSFNCSRQLFCSFTMMLKTTGRAKSKDLDAYNFDTFRAMEHLQKGGFESSVQSKYTQSLDTLYAELVCLPYDLSSVFARSVARMWKNLGGMQSLRPIVVIAVQFGVSTYLEKGLKLLLSGVQSDTASELLTTALWFHERVHEVQYEAQQEHEWNYQYEHKHDPDPDLIRLLLRCGADPDFKKNTQISLADKLLKTMTEIDLRDRPNYLLILEHFLDFKAHFGEKKGLLIILARIGNDSTSLREKIAAHLRVESSSKELEKGQTAGKKRLLLRSIFDSVRNGARKQ